MDWTWTEGVIHISDTISIGGGFFGLLTAIIAVLVCLVIMLLYGMAFFWAAEMLRDE